MDKIDEVVDKVFESLSEITHDVAWHEKEMKQMLYLFFDAMLQGERSWWRKLFYWDECGKPSCIFQTGMVPLSAEMAKIIRVRLGLEDVKKQIIEHGAGGKILKIEKKDEPS